MTSPITLPNLFRRYLDHDDAGSVNLVQCKPCGSIPEHFAKVSDFDDSGKFISLSCTTIGCSNGTWYVCCLCKMKFPRWAKASKHSKSKKHIANIIASTARISSNNSGDTPVPKDRGNGDDCFQAAFGDDDDDDRKFFPVDRDDCDNFSVATTNTINNQANDGDVMMSCSNAYSQVLADSPNDDHGSTGGVDKGINTCATSVTSDPTDISGGTFGINVNAGKPLDRGHEWLAQALKGTPKATEVEVYEALACSPNMQRFWQAEHAHTGGGVMYQVGRAVSRSFFLSPGCLPDLQEAMWHMQCFKQYMSMSDEQRERHAYILQQVTSGIHGSDLIKKTRIPNAQELKRFYKSDCQHSLWQALPIPVIHNIDGIAYVNPVDICRFAFACGLKFDNISVTKDTEPGDGAGKQFHVSDSKTIKEWMENLRKSQDEHGDFCLTLVWCSDWRDAFGVNRTKNNRKSVSLWTWSVSPTKEAVNTGDTTFPMALGQKKNPSWTKVEHQFRRDTACLANPNEPLRLYHGGMKKIVRVYIKRLNASYDKPERADITGTLGHGSNIHRCFGKLLHVQSPTCDSKKVSDFLAATRPHVNNALEWGWSDGMLDQSKGKVNGSNLPSCKECRARRIYVLFGCFPGVETDLEQTGNLDEFECKRCADWSMDSSKGSLLAFPVPEKYPTTYDPQCPIEPPTGRSTVVDSHMHVTCPSTGKTQPCFVPMELQFQNLVKAVKFAFFHCITRNTTLRWKKAQLQSYLNSNGIPDKYASDLWTAARNVVQNDSQDDVNFHDPEKIDSFHFPAAWIDPNLEVPAYIETLMHQLCLGLAQSNFALSSLWNKQRKRDTAFRRNAQPLLLDLKKFQLNWLRPYQFTASDDKQGGGYTSGAWVSENWMAWIRISKITHLFCSTKTKPSDDLTGHGDVFRLVICFTALAARALSHCGIDDSDIREFEQLLKEFLSCVKDLDIQSRYREMAEKKTVRSGDAVDSTEGGAGNQGGNSIPSRNQNSAMGGGSVRSRNKSEATGKQRSTSPDKKSQGRSGKRTKNSSGGRLKKRRTSNDDAEYIDNDEGAASSETDAAKRGKQKKSKKGNRKSTTSKTKKPLESGEVSGGNEAWWLKSNYMSLPNLVQMMELFGLLINYWDGGGKCEKFIQKVKPLITRGVHEYKSFFVVIMEKLYKYQLLDIFEEMYSMFGTIGGDDVDQQEERPCFFIAPDGEVVCNDGNDFDAPSLVDEQFDESNDGQDYYSVEARHMRKYKAFYIYRSKAALDQDIDDKKPISGILVQNGITPPGNGEAILEFYAVFRIQQSFAWYRIVFDDNDGVSRGGMWYAPLSKANDTLQEPPSDMKTLQQVSKMSTVAIPMSYGVGPNKPDSNKYCVITNWWKERKQDGRYTMPGLDPTLYVREDTLYEGIIEGSTIPNVI